MDKSMENESNFDNLEELEELEEPAEQAEKNAMQCDSESESDSDSNAETGANSISSSFLTSANLFRNSIFPIFFVDEKLKILFINEACEKMFAEFKNLSGQYIMDILGKYFSLTDIRDIRETTLKGANGYSWKGEIKIKTREIVATMTKVFIFPLDYSKQKPKEFIVMFDDITNEKRQLMRNVFLSLLEASKLKDNDTSMHIMRVNKYSERMAKELFHRKGYERIDADFIDNIGFLASMHDVGKIGTPDDILNKDGPLSDWEWMVMQEHTKNGAFILSTYPNPMAKEIALSHHERWNGSGYPFHLEGDMIPIASRIVSIADVYDALRMKRCYKEEINHEKTVEIIMQERSTQFDPVLLDVFYNINGDYSEIYESNNE
jgi:putative two-component system response regulator